MFEGMEQEFLRVFVSESREMIDDVEPMLIKIHSDTTETGEIDSDTVNAIFRLFHSMKGSAGSLGLNNIASLTHKAETLLDVFRGGKAEFELGHVDLFLRTLDLAGSFLDMIERDSNDNGKEAERKILEEELGLAIDLVTRSSERSAAAKAAATATSVVADESDINRQFIEEANEFFDLAEKILIELEKPPDNPERLIRELFRSCHSFKGNCGFLALADLSKLSHKTESVLEAFCKPGLEFAPEHVMTMLMVVDSLRQGANDFTQGGKGTVEGLEMMLDLLGQIERGIAPFRDSPKLGEILVEDGKVSEEQLNLALEKQKTPIGKILVDMGAVDNSTVEKALEKQTSQMAVGKTTRRTDIRVDLARLDELVNLIGELVIAESMVTKNPDLQGLALENFDKSVHHLRRVASNLQDVAMSIRMVPLSATFQKLVRVVHDLALKKNRKIKLNLVGEETEIDKTMTEQIADPLLHMVRNSVDHGIEDPEERVRNGKSETGNLTIEARYEGGEVWIIVSDDGKGLDRVRILEKAQEKGLVRGDPGTLRDEDVFAFIFEPGFSTSAQVSEISGRGVGMDVVKKNIEKLKGRITVRSKPGLGTSIYLQIPLTLAIIDGMLIRVGDSCYTIPLLAIRESIRAEAGSITGTPDKSELVRVREELIPVVRLYKLHNKKPQYSELHEGILVIVEDQGRKIALFVDEILGQQQTVVKGLSPYLANVHGVSGCTILGDGSVSLILDTGGLIDKASTMMETTS
ncbi:MAG: hypothetical protein A2W80_16845 [Candidatus Riflebacteria bacterium GWC2_50_8]|nr:MAG: hypothetical protein A2W80_16845 [Candidatus Riflebacteria bacterium GWC2_50_8]